MDVRIWIRWAAMHAVPGAFLAVQARRGDPLARFLLKGAAGAEHYRVIEAIRQRGRLVRTPFVWVSADHELCRTMLRDNRFGAVDPAKSGLPKPLTALIARVDPGLPNPVEPPAMLMVDPPEHTRYRRLVAHSFTPRAIDRLGDRVTEMTTQLLDTFEAGQQVDLLSAFAEQLPVAVIAEILGLPVQARPRLLTCGHRAAPLLDVGIKWTTYRQAVEGLRDLDDYLGDHFDRIRHRDSADTPFARLALDGTLTHRELAANAALLIGAGFETTVNLIGNGIVTLLDHPEQLARLHEDPSLWPNAIEEILRYDPPVQRMVRIALHDIEIAGHHIAAGETVILLPAGANRDPHVFTDPDRFDITRPNAADHLAFGTGVHACIGAALARVEGGTALRALFDTFPALRLTTAPEKRELVTLNGYRRLPAHLGAKAPAATRN
ncbi:cytochrome P450 [Nocardia sp. NPDC048505]|uniref:cytochrome P450 n=1 Tax=unclassified Nocardia TaxID=2637762 RepID=UPI0033D1A577